MSLKNFAAYRIAIEFLAESNALAENLPQGYRDLKDQLKRAALSIVLNIAEGAGNFSPTRQKYYYMLARGSAYECLAAVDAIRVLEIGNKNEVERASKLAEQIVSILTRLCEKGRWGK